MQGFTRLANPPVHLRIVSGAPHPPERVAEALLVCRYGRIYSSPSGDEMLFTLPGRGARYRVGYYPFMRGIQSFETAYEFEIHDTLLPTSAFNRETFELVLLALQWRVLTLSPQYCEDSQVHYRFVAAQMGIHLPEARVLTIYAECGAG